MFRFLDILISVVGLLLSIPICLAICVVGLIDTGSPLFFQTRVGQNKRPFVLVKFRTMRVGQPSVASHLSDPTGITPIGKFLRRTKLDEIPQLWNVVKGEMSIVGPRPCLYNQTELIAARDASGVFAVRPGITGLAQVNGIDMSNPTLLAETDAKMVKAMAISSYFRLILLTILGKGSGDRVRDL